MAKRLRRRSAKPLFGGSNPPVASIFILEHLSPDWSFRHSSLKTWGSLKTSGLRQRLLKHTPFLTHPLSISRYFFNAQTLQRLSRGNPSLQSRDGGMADAADLKSAILTDVWVRVPLPAPTFSHKKTQITQIRSGFFVVMPTDWPRTIPELCFQA